MSLKEYNIQSAPIYYLVIKVVNKNITLIYYKYIKRGGIKKDAKTIIEKI
jgi:hypothetical protein|nr:MAG TPA: hypothetical protein [Caudoviricetes sp.]